MSFRPSYRAAALWAFAACVTFCACAVFRLFTWARPIEDDFCRAALLDPPASYIPGILPYTEFIYSHWSGRWAGVGLETILVSIPSLMNGYPWLLFALIAMQGFLLYFAIRELVLDTRAALYLAAVFASVYWATMPSPQQNIFWVPGAVESQLPLTLGLLLFSLVLSPRLNATKESRRFAAIAASILGFVTTGFHELSGGVLVLALTAITATAFISKSPRRKMWLAVWMASAAGFLVVFVAPGNSVRIATFPNRGNHSLTAGWFRIVMRHYVLPWCLDFKHWLLAVLILLDPNAALLRKKLPGLSSSRSIGFFAVLWLSLVVVAVFATVWNIGDLPAGRTLDLIYGMFLTGWIALAFLVVRSDDSFSFHPVPRAATLSTALLLLSATLVTSDNTVQSIGDIVRGSAQLWSNEIDQRFEQLKSAGPNADVTVPPISVNSRDLSWEDIRTDPNYFANRCVSKYFGVASVRISRPSQK